MPNFIEIEETFCGRTGDTSRLLPWFSSLQTHGRTFETGFIRSTVEEST